MRTAPQSREARPRPTQPREIQPRELPDPEPRSPFDGTTRRGARGRVPVGLAWAWLGFLAFLLVRAAGGDLPLWARRIHAQPLGDDLAHVLVAVATTVALDRLLTGLRTRVPGGGRGAALGPWLALALLTLEELSQGLLPARVLSPQDLLASWVGVGLGVALLRGLGDGGDADVPAVGTDAAQRDGGGPSVHARGASMRSTG